jgi:hypothetical protein
MPAPILLPILGAVARAAVPALARGAASGASGAIAQGASGAAMKSAAIQGVKSAAPQAAIRGAVAGRNEYMNQGRRDAERPGSMF